MPAQAVLSPPAPVETTPGSTPTLRYKNFFAARDALNKMLEDQTLTLTGPQVALFRYLIEHAWYNPRKPKDAGYVIESALGNQIIGPRLGVNEKTIRRALPVLDELGLTSRYERPLLTGGKDPDAIRVDWLLVLDTESGSEPGRESGSEPGRESASFLYEKTGQETSSRAGDDDGSASPHSQSQNQDESLSHRDAYASWLGVEPASIGRNAVELADRLNVEYGWDALRDALEESEAKGNNPVAYFVRSGESICAQHIEEQRHLVEEAERKAEETAREAAEQAARDAERQAADAEIETLIPVIAAVGRHNDVMRDPRKGFNWHTEEEGEAWARRRVESLRLTSKGDTQKHLRSVRKLAERATEEQAAWEASMKELEQEAIA